MPAGAIAIAIVQFLAAIPEITKDVEAGIQAIMGWYIARQEASVNAAIADAAAFAAQAKTEGDRYAAAEKWRQALSATRITQ